MEIAKQLGHILSILIIISFIASVVEFQAISLAGFLVMAVIMGIIFFAYILTKKLTASYFRADEETRIWSIERYGLRPHHYFTKEVPLGVILPVIVLVLSLGTVPWYGCLQSDVKPNKYKQVRSKSSLLSFTALGDTDLALISASGIISSLVIAFFAYVINAPLLSKLAIHFAFFNMLPLGNLDGGRIFFGNRPLWMVMGVITLIALAYSFFLV
jgi:Zn-dependent protease